ncbi:FAD-dependent oxidoreductase [Planktothrix paucivesiculata]|uniref:Monoamine oxidase n=1 Tax=Planktothrix paucivesiculata PCC 9631 TaxID=671071 RepID=A0A7Z9E0Z5_9CYAN|nr:FAD-dependent oxidoreductase [Planktothrix paucivesiculata]VXD20438.1 Monoamine oxidase [Planktothrix paucivesiculata PCC 9631]
MQFIPNFNKSRRNFIQLSALVAASFPLWLSCQNNSQAISENIIIIGAGIAGIAAAKTLKSQGFKVTILEARDRIGGRIYTDKTLGFPVDLGASWIHGIQNNPIGKLAHDFNIGIKQTNDYHVDFYTNNQNKIPDSELEKAESLYEKIIARAKSWSENQEQDVSVNQAVNRFFKPDNLSLRQAKLVNWLLTSEILIETGADLEKLSIWELDEDEAFDGEDYLFPNGYEQIIQNLAQGLEIKLQHPVTEIQYNNQQVTVKTPQGDFSGSAVLITIPLGVLKANQVKFIPELPQDKKTAIQKFNLGVLNKVVLKFPQVFWEKSYEFLGYLPESSPNFTVFMNYDYYNSSPMLMALTGGSFARSLETMTQQQLTDKIMAVLREMYGNSIPNPQEILVTRWSSDPYTLGSYSYIPPGTTAKERDSLASPVNNMLFFAGEATSRQYPATVHGAYLSGLREAQRIQQIFMN